MKRALQLVLVLGGVGLALAAGLATREILGAASPAFAWPSARGTVIGYPASLVDLVIYAAIVSATVIGLVAGRARRGSTAVVERPRYVPPSRRVPASSRRSRIPS